jgi:uroporphyrinogen-III synthase
MTDRRARRALVTRPAEDAEEIVAALRDRGMEAVLAPMMRVVHRDRNIDADAARAQTILFTSRNGVRAFCAICDRRDVPVLAVGDSTARLAVERGFGSVQSAGGDSADLARLAAERLRPADGPLLHAAGETVAGTLSETLSAAGFQVVRRPIYAAEPVDALSPAAVEALSGDMLVFVLLFSPRTARLFAERVRNAGLEPCLARLTAVCLSPAVAAETEGSDWARRAVAARPTTGALLEALDASDPEPEDRG